MDYLKPFLFFICVHILCFASAILSDVLKTPFDYVDPMIGTNHMGHTFPGATMPFGMVQLSPDTDNPPFFLNDKYNPKVYEYCAGYQYSDETILGFSHTHFNGTGHSDLGDILIMPTVGEIQLDPGTAAEPEQGYRSRFSHNSEEAQPGYYKVKLSDYDIVAELTASRHVGFHRYTFPETNDAHIILDLDHSIYNYDGKVIWVFLRRENDTLITGYRQTKGWARTRYLYFAIEFSKPFSSYGLINQEKELYRGFWDRAVKQGENCPEIAGKKIKAYFNFDTTKDEQVKIKVAISSVSTEGALKNLHSEIPHWDFEKVREEAKSEWNRELSKIQIEASEKEKTIFYTALYHTLLNPVEYSDVDGGYRGLDQNIHNAENYTKYSIFSLWDTYRAQHPLLTILQPSRVADMIKSMLSHYDESAHKILPIWSFHSNEDWCMTGYHAIPVIADAYIKGIRGFDIEKAFKASVDSALYEKYSGLENYIKYGYVPFDLEFGQNSASKTLEYAYDDWTVANFAKAMGRNDIADQFFKRAQNYRNLYDESTKFIRAKDSKGNWLEPFDPLKTAGQGYIEGNALNYSLHIPQDIKGYTDLLGGEKNLEDMLDQIFTSETPEESYEESEDIDKRGVLGSYIHGNEPSHHIPYLYNWTGSPWKTQEIVRKIVTEMYSDETDGLPGNEDTGQMSAWYIFSALGFYPVCPGTDQYVIGAPQVKRAVINLSNGKTFEIVADGISESNKYIKSVSLNGKPLDRSYITHSEIMNGGKLTFILSDEPNKTWATQEKDHPYSMTE
ncbi:MAG: GH92 family glycosyl hydrolase [Acidobacteria bacterium]|nr:GH92 family glycosyl hydrolase [Acidobacteriota bacterium]